MAMEYYASAAARLSRIFPIFFGSRVDVFGPIGNLFSHHHYTNLPRVKPVASVELAAKLLRENGVEPRPEMFELTVLDIVDSMKRFLCVFAWNIENPANVTSECVNQVLAVVRGSLDETAKVEGNVNVASSPSPLLDSAGKPSQEASNVSHEGEMNHQDVWAIIHNEKYVTDLEAMRKCLQDDLGIYDADDLIDLDKEHLVAISECLKPAQKKKLLRCSRIC